jgi:hypothetical protein
MLPMMMNPRRRRRSSNPRRRSRNPRGRIRHVYHVRTKNPSYRVKDVLITVVTVGAGFVGTKGLSSLILKKKPEWNMGYKAAAVHAVSAIAVSAIGYGVVKAIKGGQTAKKVGGELLVGGLVATGLHLFMTWKSNGVAPAASTSAPAPQAAAGAPAPAPAPAGTGFFSPAQMRNAAAASNLVRKGTGGFITPQALAAAGVAEDFVGEKNF